MCNIETYLVLYSTAFVPPILSPSGIVDVTEGDNLTLFCQDPGNSNVETYEWVNDSSGEDLGDETISPPLAYTITNIQREASGNYSCVLTDDTIPYYEPTSTVTINIQCKFISTTTCTVSLSL